MADFRVNHFIPFSPRHAKPNSVSSPVDVEWVLPVLSRSKHQQSVNDVVQRSALQSDYERFMMLQNCRTSDYIADSITVLQHGNLESSKPSSELNKSTSCNGAISDGDDHDDLSEVSSEDSMSTVDSVLEQSELAVGDTGEQVDVNAGNNNFNARSATLSDSLSSLSDGCIEMISSYVDNICEEAGSLHACNATNSNRMSESAALGRNHSDSILCPGSSTSLSDMHDDDMMSSYSGNVVRETWIPDDYPANSNNPHVLGCCICKRSVSEGSLACEPEAPCGKPTTTSLTPCDQRDLNKPEAADKKSVGMGPVCKKCSVTSTQSRKPARSGVKTQSNKSETSVKHWHIMNVSDQCSLFEYKCILLNQQLSVHHANYLQQVYCQIADRCGKTIVRHIRGDNFAALRAVLFQALANNFLQCSRIGKFEHSCQKLRAFSDPRNQFLCCWNFANRIPYDKGSEAEVLFNCLEELHSVIETLACMPCKVCREDFLAILLNSNPDTDVRLMESVKFLMMAKALCVYNDIEWRTQCNYPQAAEFWMFTSLDPEQLFLQRINPVGDSCRLQAMEFQLLGYALDLQIEIIRPSMCDECEFVTRYLCEGMESCENLCLILEDDDEYCVLTA